MCSMYDCSHSEWAYSLLKLTMNPLNIYTNQLGQLWENELVSLDFLI